MDPKTWVCSGMLSSLVPALSLLLISPLLAWDAYPGIAGIGFVHTPTDIWQFIMVHGWFFAAFLFSFRRELMKVPWDPSRHRPVLSDRVLSLTLAGLVLVFVIRRESGPADLLAAGGLAILLFCELIYLADNMGDLLPDEHGIQTLHWCLAPLRDCCCCDDWKGT